MQMPGLHAHGLSQAVRNGDGFSVFALAIGLSRRLLSRVPCAAGRRWAPGGVGRRGQPHDAADCVDGFDRAFPGPLRCASTCGIKVGQAAAGVRWRR